MNRLIKHIVFGVAMFAGSTAMAGITFYESENFGGRQIGGNEAMPNFRAIDFNDRARSAIIDGGPWEVCVGTNFGNDCTVLAPGRYPTLGEWSQPDQLGAAGIVAAGKPATAGRHVAATWPGDIL